MKARHDEDLSPPWRLLREDVIVKLGITVKESFERLGMSPAALSRVFNGTAAISPDLAIRLEIAGVSAARFWIALQGNYDLAQALRHDQPKVKLLQTV